MAKIVKIRIVWGDRSKGEDVMTYPAGYDPHEIQKQENRHILPGGIYSGHMERGDPDGEWVLRVVNDAYADQLAQDPLMEIIPPAEADILAEEWRLLRGESEEIVDDLERIQAINAKTGAGIALSAEDMKALDINDPTVKGVNKRLRTLTGHSDITVA